MVWPEVRNSADIGYEELYVHSSPFLALISIVTLSNDHSQGTPFSGSMDFTNAVLSVSGEVPITSTAVQAVVIGGNIPLVVPVEL